MTITIKLSFKFVNKTRNLSADFFYESTTFGFDSYWYKHNKLKNITFGLDSCWYKNSRPQATNTINGLVKTQKKSQKEYVLEYLTSYPSSSDSSSSKSDSSDEKKYNKSKRKVRNKNKSVGNSRNKIHQTLC